MVWVHVDAIDEYMDLTSIEAYPDDDDDGVQDDLTLYDACEDFADTPEDLHPEEGKALRSNNLDTVIMEDEEIVGYKPLISLDDVKPGDFGELTLSFHLCDNPGYIWLNGQLVSANENGTPEPEAKDPDEEEGVVELLDSVQTMLWYDEDGDNVYEPGGFGGQVDVMMVIDRSGSMGGTPIANAQDAAKTLVNELGGGAEIGLTTFAASASLDQGMTGNKAAVNAAIDAISTGGLTNHEDAIQTAQQELEDGGREGVPNIMVILTDGNSTAGGDPQDDAQAARDAGTEIYAVGFGDVNESVINGFASDPDDEYAFIGDVSELQQIFAQISQILVGEECFWTGSLRQTLNLLSGKNAGGTQQVNEGLGIPLDGNRATPYDEIVHTPGRPNAGDDPAREPFVASTTNAIGLAWWLPVDHANEIQTDSVGFDLGVYAEQGRHNDGAGMGRLVPTREGDGWVKMEADFNGDGTESSFARGRFGDNLPTGAWEVAVGNATGDAAEGNYVWTPGETVPWSYVYDADTNEATFSLDDVTVGPFEIADQPDGRVGIQTKADEATIMVEDVSMTAGGNMVHLSGPTSVMSSNDDAPEENGSGGRDLDYLVINSDLDGETSFTLEGMVTVDIQPDFPGNDEAVAFDVVLE
jgi:hypothetical protein